MTPGHFGGFWERFDYRWMKAVVSILDSEPQTLPVFTPVLRLIEHTLITKPLATESDNTENLKALTVIRCSGNQ